MNSLVKLVKLVDVPNDDFVRWQKLYNEVQSHIWSLSTLGTSIETMVH